MERMTEQDYLDIEYAMESVLDTAIESVEGAAKHIIDPKSRDCLPDRAFGIVFTDEEGNRHRKYPLVIKKDPETTRSLVMKVVSKFHYCRPDWKEPLAKKILQVIKEEKIEMTINKKSQLFKYINEKDLPKTVKIIETQK